MKIATIVQARMSSKRLPGKSLTLIEGKPILQYVVEKVAHSVQRAEVIVATSSQPEDDPIQAFCTKENVRCHRGPLEDVALRFKQIVESYGLTAFVRVSGDSPLIDPGVIDEAIRLFQSGPWDLASNIVVRTFPKGQSVEVVRSAAFLKAYPKMTDPSDREHVTPFFYRHATDFHIAEFRSDQNCGAVNLSVDTADDLRNVEEIIRSMSRPHWTYGWKEILDRSNSLRRKTA